MRYSVRGFLVLVVALLARAAIVIKVIVVVVREVKFHIFFDLQLVAFLLFDILFVFACFGIFLF